MCFALCGRAVGAEPEADYNLPKSVSNALEKACPDGACGEVAKFPVDPASKQVPELIVRPAPGGRLCPD